MKFILNLCRTAIFLLCPLVAATVTGAALPEGLWHGELAADAGPIGFDFRLSRQANGIQGAFVDSVSPTESAPASQDEGRIELDFPHLAGHLSLVAEGEIWRGTYAPVGGSTRAVTLRRAAAVSDPPADAVPHIGGVWWLAMPTAKGEQVVRLIIRQHGGEVEAAILRVDGDTGLIHGHYRGDRFVLDHFDGARAHHVDIVPDTADRLSVTLYAARGQAQTYPALRPEQSAARPADEQTHTRWRTPSQPLKFSALDPQGHAVTERDPAWAGHALLVAIGGSWCPNCHDEAPYLEELYERYAPLGLRVVSLSFEEAEQRGELARLRAFTRRYGLRYPVLLAGEPQTLAAAFPEADGLDAWPTTFFVDRTGHVRHIHTGFAGRASGEFHQALREEYEEEIARLLAE